MSGASKIHLYWKLWQNWSFQLMLRKDSRRTNLSLKYNKIQLFIRPTVSFKIMLNLHSTLFIEAPLFFNLQFLWNFFHERKPFHRVGWRIPNLKIRTTLMNSILSHTLHQHTQRNAGYLLIFDKLHLTCSPAWHWFFMDMILNSNFAIQLDRNKNWARRA